MGTTPIDLATNKIKAGVNASFRKTATNDTLGFNYFS
jgi:hypothetical protein